MEFFDRRGVPPAEALADETLDRVARRLDGGEAVEHVRPYCFGVAKRVLLEWQKGHAKEAAAWAARPDAGALTDAAAIEARVACLERCLDELSPDSRALVIEYYQGPGRVHQDGRKLQAERLGISYTALKARTHRIRCELTACLQRCLGQGGDR